MVRAALMRVLRPGAEIITRRRVAGVFAVAAAATPIGAASAQNATDATRTPWATVNVCDTERWPDTIGIRGSMPGSKDEREGMWMRFQVEFKSTEDARWHAVPEGGDSGFVFVGQARSKPRQAGRSFRISPKRGETVLLRGRVSFEWRLKGEVLRSATQRTRRGHRSTAGSDPPGYTATTCTVTPDS